MSSFHAKRNGALRTLVRLAVLALLVRAFWRSTIGSAIRRVEVFSSVGRFEWRVRHTPLPQTAYRFELECA